MKFEEKQKYSVDDLLCIMDLLRCPTGCPWDKEQNHHSIRKNLIEETYEVVEAIDNEDSALLQEELGDLLLQIVFHAQMEKELGAFTFEDVCDGICKKLIIRHPHIFSDTVATTSKEVLASWENIKNREKKQTTATQTLECVPRTLPSLMRSAKVQQRAAKTGFDYPDVQWAIEHLRSELDELEQAMREQDTDSITMELGDVLFSTVNISRFLQVDAEHALSLSCDKFIARFASVEQLATQRGINMQGAHIDLLNSLWAEAKNKDTKILEV